MSGTRNIRFILPLLAAILIVGVFLTSMSSVGSSLQRTNFGAAESKPPSDEMSDRPNQLSTPKSTPKKPYTKQGDGSGNDVISDSADKVVADKGVADRVLADKLIPSQNAQGHSNPQATKFEGDNSKDKSVVGSCDDRSFVIMIDAGSTGSRVHVYEFDVCTAPPKLLHEEFEMLKPGLSHYDTDAEGAAKSLDPLLEVALKTVPKDKHGCTPISVKATAGLRLLGEDKSNKILEEVRKHLENDYPFAVVPGDGISLMDGKDEGVYAWITTNYLLGNIGGSEADGTVAVFDLGGGSTQIIFEPKFAQNEVMAEGEHKYELSFGGNKYSLYQFSHLGYGLMQGRNKINALVVEGSLESNKELANAKFSSEADLKDAKATVDITNPCIPPGMTAENVQVKISDSEYYLVNMKSPSTPGGSQCRFLAEKVLKKDSECKNKPCSFNGVHQPSLTRTFKATSDMYIFSYFYDRTNPLGFPSSFTIEELRDLAKVVCGGDTMWKDVLLDPHVKELNEEPHWCMDLSFITALLHTGYDIPLYREVRTAKTIDNNELGWCLGASLPLLDKSSSGWSCKVSSPL